MTLVSPPDPTTQDLQLLVEEVLADPERWRSLVQHGEQRHFDLLHRDEDIELWVVSWMPGHDTGFHDHDESAAAIIVAEGEIREQRLTVGHPNVDRRFATGQALTVRPCDIHRLQHAGTEPSVTIHAYSPPLGRMGQYEIAPDGTLQRYAQATAGAELRQV